MTRRSPGGAAAAGSMVRSMGQTSCRQQALRLRALLWRWPQRQLSFCTVTARCWVARMRRRSLHDILGDILEGVAVESSLNNGKVRVLCTRDQTAKWHQVVTAPESSTN